VRRFWDKVQEPRVSGKCWVWMGAVSPNGYGRFQRDGENRMAHREAYRLAFGKEPPVVRHLCHNRRCVNPGHLASGDHLDNMRDMVEAGRQARGEAHGGATLSDEEADEIRSVPTYYGCNQWLADEYGVSVSLVQKIRAGRRRGASGAR
jgi:hypothetical protein